ncbi:hypothetical protein DIS24_g10139 [Lasiodiplodia hormozganensis]|uniref:Uncharacterized protein n=1 Tax=Lasiodiplodia hormozganensis TaxID=869390 RepID=A0AA39XQ20_9PEZI|nr:hypothetical protein DIS24_g10139 [Lasiodiplodia hormozganensis]
MGTLIIIVSFTIEPFVGCVQKRCHKHDYARLEWCTNETLQLQRLAHEEVGAGGMWTHATDAVPVAQHGEPLAMLDLKDRGHPRLRAPVVGVVVDVVEKEEEKEVKEQQAETGEEQGEEVVFSLVAREGQGQSGMSFVIRRESNADD